MASAGTVEAPPRAVTEAEASFFRDHGWVKLEQFVSETIGLGDVEAAFGAMAHGDVLRSVVLL